MNNIAENNHITEDNLQDMQSSPKEQVTTEHHNTDGEHHHHHSDGEHHHSGSHHHHHHHNHHHNHHLSSNSGKSHNGKRKFRGIRKSLKSFFSKFYRSDKNESETEKQRLLKRVLFLFLIIALFFASFYILVIDNLNGETVKNAINSPSETDILKRQLSQSQSKIKALEEELQAYKDKFGELELPK